PAILESASASAADVPTLLEHVTVHGKDDERMTETPYHPSTPEIAAMRKRLAPDAHAAFENFSRTVFAEGALPEKTKQLIAVAVAHVTQCPYCINGHTRLARRKGASPEEIMEAIWVAAEMRAGGAFAHSTLALHTMSEMAPTED
ncbi:MAG TPA: carboxymuconolactone decarboxylase family protein, partial [Thermopolyspora sp.]